MHPRALPSLARPRPQLAVWAACLAAALAGWSTSVTACPLPAADLQQEGVQAQWAVAGAKPIAVGRHFALDVMLCPPDATLLRVDASMPEHRHGMNYRPTVQDLGGGRWRAEGLMFHMPGRWELKLDVQAAGRTVLLRDTVNQK
jgi:hypothetical protein